MKFGRPLAVAGVVGLAEFAAACNGGHVDQAPVSPTMTLEVGPPAETRTVPRKDLDALGRWIVRSSQHAEFSERAAGSVRGSTAHEDIASLAGKDRHIQGSNALVVSTIDYGYTWDALHATLPDGTCANIRLPGVATVYVRTTPAESSVRYEYKDDPTTTFGAVKLCNPVEEGQPGTTAEVAIMALPASIRVG